MTDTHTPGPLERFLDETARESGFEDIAPDEFDEFIFDLRRGLREQDEIQRVVLAALKNARAYLDGGPCFALLDEIDAAIAKAEGA